MFQFIRDAGVGIYAVGLFGIVGVAVALWHAMSPTRERRVLLTGLAIATILLGALGAVTGMQASAQHVGEIAEPLTVFLAGASESLNQLVAALAFAVAQAILGTVGSFRVTSSRSAAA